MAVLGVLGLHAAVRALSRPPSPVRRDPLRDYVASQDDAQRRGRIWRQLAVLQQAARSPSIDSGSYVRKVAAATGQRSPLRAMPSSQEDKF